MNADDYCQQKAAQSGSSFYYSFRFLPPEQRRAITALYAFCREVDDVVDECSDPLLAANKLNWWRGETTAMFNGNPSHPVCIALSPFLERFNLSQEYFQEIIDGMEMDLQQNRYQDWKELSLYCYRVASAVGLLTIEIFGYEDRNTIKYAKDLGMAFQLTNIIRDVREDAQRDRIYLPLQDLQQFAISEQDILNFQQSSQLEALLQHYTHKAREYYHSAFDHLSEGDRYAQRSGLIMAEIYLATLDEIEADKFQVMKHRIKLTPIRKLWIAWNAARREKQRFRRNSRAVA